MGKRKFESWAMAEAAYDRASKEGSVLMLALTDVLHKEVEWLSEKPMVGVSRLAAPHGGIVVFMEKGMPANAFYLDAWCDDIEKRPAPASSNKAEYEAWIHLRSVAVKAKDWQRRIHEGLMQKVPSSK